jgi:hypothetical protein
VAAFAGHLQEVQLQIFAANPEISFLGWMGESRGLP